LDIIYRAKTEFNVPVFAYQVSGEYALVEAGAAAGIGDRDALMMEKLIAFKRAGCSGILTYYAADAARLLRDGAFAWAMLFLKRSGFACVTGGKVISSRLWSILTRPRSCAGWAVCKRGKSFWRRLNVSKAIIRISATLSGLSSASPMA